MGAGHGSSSRSSSRSSPQPQGRPPQPGQGGLQEQRPQMPPSQQAQRQQAQRQQPPSPPKQARGVPPPQQGPVGQPGLRPLTSHGGPHASSAGVNPQIGPGGYPMPMPNVPGMDPATMQAAVMAAQASMAQHQNFAAHQVMMQQMLHGQLSPHLQSHPSLMSHPMLHQNLPLMMAGGMPMYPALSHLAAMSGGVPMMNPGMNGLGAGTGVFMPSMQGMNPMQHQQQGQSAAHKAQAHQGNGPAESECCPPTRWGRPSSLRGVLTGQAFD